MAVRTRAGTVLSATVKRKGRFTAWMGLSGVLCCHWRRPPAWWAEGSIVWYLCEDYRVHLHTRHEDGSITYALLPLAHAKEGA